MYNICVPKRPQKNRNAWHWFCESNSMIKPGGQWPSVYAMAPLKNWNQNSHSHLLHKAQIFPSLREISQFRENWQLLWEQQQLPDISKATRPVTRNHFKELALRCYTSLNQGPMFKGGQPQLQMQKISQLTQYRSSLFPQPFCPSG